MAEITEEITEEELEAELRKRGIELCCVWFEIHAPDLLRIDGLLTLEEMRAIVEVLEEYAEAEEESHA